MKAKDIPETIQERRRLIKQQLEPCIGKSYYCKSLDCKVKIIDKSVEETAYQGALSKQATKLALNLPEVIRNATIIALHLPPKAGRQQSRMHFKEIANLMAVLPRVGKAKLTVGFVESGDCIEYAITEYKTVK